MSKVLAAAESLIETDPTSALDGACAAFAAASTDGDRLRAALICARAHLAGAAWSDAVAWLDRATAVRDRGLTRALRGYARFRAGHRKSGLAELEAAAARDPSEPEAHLRRGEVLAALGHHALAVDALSPAVAAPATAAEARRRRGEALLAIGARADAIADLVAAACAQDVDAVEQLRQLGVAPKAIEHRVADAILARTFEDGDQRCAELLGRADLTAVARAALLSARAGAANDRRDWGEAVALRRAAVACSADPTLRVRLARELWNAAQFGEAAAVAESAIADGACDGSAEETIAMSHDVERRPADAERWYVRALALRPRAPFALYRLGRLRLANGSAEDGLANVIAAAAYGSAEASEYLTEHDEAEPGDWQQSAAQYHDDGHHAEAAERFAREAAMWIALSRAPGDSAAIRAADAWSNAGATLRIGGDARAAEAAARTAIELHPASRDAWAHLGDHLTMLARPLDAAAAFRRAIDLDSRSAWPWYGLAGAERAAGRSREALAAIDRALAIGYGDCDPRDLDLHLRRGQICQALGDWDGAIASYRARAKATSGDPVYALPALNIEVARDLARRGPGRAASPPAPYRRYGLALDQWVHTEFPFAYRAQLATVPSATTRVAIACAMRSALRVDWFTLDETWSWSDRFVMIRLCPSEAARWAPKQVFRAIGSAFDAIHAVAPLVEVVALGARSIDRNDPAERWSIATQPVPDPGPYFGDPAALWTEAIADVTRFPPPIVDADVEAARAR